MKHFQLTTTQTEAISSANTDQAISNFTVNITPTSANSIIKLEAQLLYESANEPWETMFFFFRDSTKLAHTESAGSRRVGIASPTVNYHSANNASTVEMVHMGYFDSPSSTSSIAYKLGINTNATNNLFINRTVDDTDSNGHERGVSWISAMEIAQ
tara:strand:+ start:7451 stop:7918 length:468 start_codon:yes stop_codon:yes gene_type:complete